MIENLDGIFETVNFQKSKGILIHHLDYFEDFPAHWHTPLEIIRDTRNWYQITSNEETCELREGDIALIRPGTIHALHAPQQGSRTIFLADISFFSHVSNLETLLALLPPVSVVTAAKDAELHRRMSDLLDRIEEEYANAASFYEGCICGLLIELLGLLGRCRFAAGTQTDTGSAQSCRYAERMLRVCSYLNEHCTEELSLAQAAELAGFSKYHFARLFKEFAHTSFYKYLNKKRISHAEQLLSNPDYSVTEVALHSGFSSLPAFIRMFKQLKGCTPTAFRTLYSLDCMNRVAPKTPPTPKKTSAG